MLQLQKKKEATMAQVKKLQHQQAVNIELLQRNAGNVQHAATPLPANMCNQSSNLTIKLNAIINILNINFVLIDNDLSKSFYNQNVIYNTMETSHQNST